MGPDPKMALDFELLAASDPRVCLLVDTDGIVLSANTAARHALPGLVPGEKLAGLSPLPANVADYIRLCAKSRSAVPGVIQLISQTGEPVSWIGHGGSVELDADGVRWIVVRLEQAEQSKSVLLKTNQQIGKVDTELAKRKHSENIAGHLAAIISSSTDAIYSKDLNNIITSWNGGAERIFGFTAREMIGQPVACLIPPDKLGEERKLVERLKAGETVEPFDTLRQTRNGTLIDASVTSSPIRNATGAIIGISAIVRDITARKQTDQALNAANETFRQLVQNSPFGIYAVDADFRIAQVSTGAQRVFENVRPLIGHDFAQALRIIWPEHAASEFIKYFRHTLETGEAYHAPTAIETRHDIEEREAYDWKIERMMLPDGRPGVVCHFYDLSERLRYETALRDSEQRFRGTFDNASVGIAHVSTEGRWLEINDRLCQLVGYTRAELLELSLDSIRKTDLSATDQEQLQEVLQGRSDTHQFEQLYVRKDGSDVWVAVSVGVQRDDENHPLYLIYVVRDISERKTAQEHQRFLMHELSHRSKNQLAVVQAIANQTARTADSTEEFRSVFSQRLSSLTLSINLLIDGKWSGVSLRDLIDRQLEAFNGDDDSRLYCDGPDVTLSGAAAEAIGLAFHELSTNCLKYGAWSVPAGKVELTWHIPPAHEDDQHMVLKWVECGGPPVRKPTRRGFGQTVIEQMIVQKLDATVELMYPVEGASWTLSLPLRHATPLR